MTRPVRVIVADDHEVVRQGLLYVLDAEPGITVVAEAGSGREAAELASVHRPDVVLMDVRMPDGNGVEACREIRQRDGSVHVVMLTAFPDEEATFASVMAGAAGFLLKDVRGPELAAAVRDAAAGRTLLDADTTARVLERLQAGAPDDRDPRIARLSEREELILEMIGEGMTNKEIARRVNLSDKTVKNHVSVILRKLEVRRRAEAASYIAALRATQPGPRVWTTAEGGPR